MFVSWTGLMYLIEPVLKNYSLLKKGFFSYTINLLRVWFRSQQLCVKWGAAMSESFRVTCGVKQGRILSCVFNIHVDGLYFVLNYFKAGCSIDRRIVIYVDDIVVFCPSPSGL